MGLIQNLAKLVFGAILIVGPYNPKTTNKFKSKYDYIVVGAGSAGCVVASRLSEDPCVNVLLLEAGPKANVLTDIPAAALLAEHTENDWRYKTVPQKRGALGYDNQQMPVPRGKGLGGTSLLNFMFYVRGNKNDYDNWENHGATGWAYENVLPYFKKMEDNTDQEFVKNGYHGTGGPLTVQSLQYEDVIIKSFSKAGIERGFTYGDINGENQTGYYKMQGTTRNGQRCSTAKAYLIPAQDRPNLDIVTDALVTQVLIDNNKVAYGVKFEKDNKIHSVHAKKEVIVSGGTINSPQILMLSGIGPKDHLESLGIPVLVDLPVGNNLQDHVGTFHLPFEASGAETLVSEILFHPLTSIPEYNLHKIGPITSLAGGVGIAFLNSKYNDPSLNWPDLQIHLHAFSASIDAGFISKGVVGIPTKVYNQVYLPYVLKSTFTFYPCFLRQKSRGTIRLASKNPKDYPLIDPNLFEDEEDLKRLVAVMQECVDIVTKTEAFKKINAKMFTTKFPGCEQYEMNSTYYSEEYIRCIAVRYTLNLWHPAGSNKMGSASDKTTVVDPQLKVKGVKNLRVVDASIFPYQVSGNTNVPTIMTAEKASDMIKQDNADRKKC